MIHKPILTEEDQINAVKRHYELIQEMLENCPLEREIELYNLIKRCDAIVDRIERNMEVPSHLN